MLKKCSGCGIILQTVDSDKVGYCKTEEHDLCMRCFKIIHANQLPDIRLENSEFEKLLLEIGKSNKLIIWVMDIFDLTGSYIRDIEKYIKGNKVILVGNKFDLIPKAHGEKKVKNWFIDSIDDDINVVDVILTSAKKKFNVDKLLELIDEFSTGDVYVIGATNTGKSSLVNAIMNSLFPGKKKGITTSYYSGTTLSTIEIVVDDFTTIVDTPGIINDFQVTNYLTTSSLKCLNPTKEVRQRIYQLDPAQTLFISGLFRMDFLEGEKSSFAIFASADVKIHRTKYSKAENFYTQHVGTDLLSPPTMEELPKLPEMIKTSFTLEEGDHSIGLGGLGYINIIAKSAIKIDISSPEKVAVELRKKL